MSDLGVGLCWIAAIVAFCLFDVWLYFYAKRKQEEEDLKWKEYIEMFEKERKELIEKGIIDEYGNFLKKEENVEEKEKELE